MVLAEESSMCKGPVAGGSILRARSEQKAKVVGTWCKLKIKKLAGPVHVEPCRPWSRLWTIKITHVPWNLRSIISHSFVANVAPIFCFVHVYIKDIYFKYYT